MEKTEFKARRNKVYVSQKQLSLKTGISRYKISDFECGYCELTDIELLKINSYLEQLEFEQLKEKRGVL